MIGGSGQMWAQYHSSSIVILGRVVTQYRQFPAVALLHLLIKIQPKNPQRRNQHSDLHRVSLTSS